jgi:hypothetical protein
MLLIWQGDVLGYNFAPHGLEPSTRMVRANLVLSGRLPHIATVHIDHGKVRHEQSIYLPCPGPCCGPFMWTSNHLDVMVRQFATRRRSASGLRMGRIAVTYILSAVGSS